MSVLQNWKDRLQTLQAERKFVEMHAIACECLRLSVPMHEHPSHVLELIRLAESYVAGETIDPTGMSFEQAEALREHRGFMTVRERRTIRETAGPMVLLATRLDYSHNFAQLALGQLSTLIDAHLERKLGTAAKVDQILEKIYKLYSKHGETSSMLHQQFPEAAKRLKALLAEPNPSKTLDRLSVFRSFTVHKSFRHVASEQSRERGEVSESPDHTGPSYKVRKLGETLGIQLTMLSSEPGRSRTELTPAGLALADWIELRPDLFA